MTAFFALQFIDRFATTRDHSAGRLPGVIDAADFPSAPALDRWRTMWGSLELIVARKPSELRSTVAPPVSPVESCGYPLLDPSVGKAARKGIEDSVSFSRVRLLSG